MLKIVKVKGDSMQPSYRHGDYVLVTSFGKSLLNVGDDIVCQHPHFGLMLKRINAIESEQLYLTGLNSLSTSVANLGSVNRQDVVGRVVLHVKQD